jgi:hypothetical protein
LASQVFLDAGVQVADLRLEADDDLAVDLHHQAQNSVHGGVLRPHVQDHVLIMRARGRRSFEDGIGWIHQRYPSTG